MDHPSTFKQEALLGQIDIHLHGQASSLAGQKNIRLPCSESITLQGLAIAIQERGHIKNLLFRTDGSLSTQLLYFIDDQQVDVKDNPLIDCGAQVSILSPISGG